MTSKFEFPQFNYNPQQYNKDLIRGVEMGPRPYDLTQEIVSRISSDGVLLDVGCGSGSKLLPLVNKIGYIVGIDKNPLVISEAALNIDQVGVENIQLGVGDCNNLPIQSESVDMITYMLSPHNAQEAMRVVKKDGYVIADRVGERDKTEIKQFFTDEKRISRGYRSDLPEGEIARVHQEDFERTGFQDVICKDYFWQTKYTPEGLWALLNSTPTIKSFDSETDRYIFEQACTQLATPEGITLTQHRVLVIAQK